MKIEKWVVREHRGGVPDVSRIYEKVVEEVDGALRDDEMLLKMQYVSVDSYLHGIFLATPLGDRMGADSIMKVLAAGPRAAFEVGDLVQGFGGGATTSSAPARRPRGRPGHFRWRSQPIASSMRVGTTGPSRSRPRWASYYSNRSS